MIQKQKLLDTWTLTQEDRMLHLNQKIAVFKGGSVSDLCSHTSFLFRNQPSKESDQGMTNELSKLLTNLTESL